MLFPSPSSWDIVKDYPNYILDNIIGWAYRKEGTQYGSFFSRLELGTPGHRVLPRDGDQNRDGEPIPGIIRGGAGDGEPVGQDEGRGVGGVRPHIGRGGPQAPAVRICGTAEVTPTGVGIHVAGHPRDRRGVCTGGGGDRKGVPPGII